MTRIVVTGMGVMTSVGCNVEQFWSNLLSGVQGVKPIRSFPVVNHPYKLGCEIEDLHAYSGAMNPAWGRATRMFVTTVEDALHDAGIRLPSLSLAEIDRTGSEGNGQNSALETGPSADFGPSPRIGLCIGTTMGELEALEESTQKPSRGRLAGPNMIAEYVTEELQLSGPVWTLTNACAAGNFAIARAVEELVAGRADMMIAGGVDAMSWSAFTGFGSLRAMAPDVCRPFDAGRKGLLLGEGAGVVILETEEHAVRRGAVVRASLLGYGLGCDANHITQPDPEAEGAEHAMQRALAMAGLDKEQIGYVSAHGTGTLANDRMEAKALSRFFGPGIRTSSIKGHIGHTLGAASAIEAVACIKALESGVLPPNLNLREKDPLCNVEVIANEPLPYRAEYMLSNAYAFGGINSTIVLGRA